MNDKIKIEPGSVQETLIIPLYARKKCSDKFPRLYSDPMADKICERIEYDFSALDKKYESLTYEFGAMEGAMRQMDKVEVKDGAVFYAAGVFHYLKRSDVKRIVLSIAERFPGARLVFDTVGTLGYKMMMKVSLKEHGMNDFGNLFYTNNAVKDLFGWSKRIKVSTRGYMLGYYDMKAPGVKGAHRFLSKVGDGLMKMQIVKIDTAGA